MTCQPAWATPDPPRPPINAWELDDGMPARQVMTCQQIAPTSAPKITWSVMMLGVTMPVPIVLATCWPNTRNATKLKNAAQNTA